MYATIHKNLPKSYGIDNKRLSDIYAFISFIGSTAFYICIMNLTGFIVSRDTVRTFNIKVVSLFTQNNFSKNLVALNR